MGFTALCHFEMTIYSQWPCGYDFSHFFVIKPTWWSLVIFNTRYIIWGILNVFLTSKLLTWKWNIQHRSCLKLCNYQNKNFRVDFINFICLILAFGWQNDQDEYERHNSGRVRACPDLGAQNRQAVGNLQ